MTDKGKIRRLYKQMTDRGRIRRVYKQNFRTEAQLQHELQKKIKRHCAELEYEVVKLLAHAFHDNETTFRHQFYYNHKRYGDGSVFDGALQCVVQRLNQYDGVTCALGPQEIGTYNIPTSYTLNVSYKHE